MIEWFGWRRLVSRRVAVQIRKGGGVDRAVLGVLIRRRGPLLFLADVTIVEDGERARADGEFVVERSVVDWIQVVPMIEAREDVG